VASSIQGMLMLSTIGLAIHGAVVGFAEEMLSPGFFGHGHPAAWLPLALVGAFVGASAVCLPSFYFYTQLSGLDASFRLVTAQALRVQAKTSELLLAALPFYVALALGGAVQHRMDSEPIVLIGLALPFLVGLLG